MTRALPPFAPRGHCTGCAWEETLRETRDGAGERNCTSPNKGKPGWGMLSPKSTRRPAWCPGFLAVLDTTPIPPFDDELCETCGGAGEVFIRHVEATFSEDGYDVFAPCPDCGKKRVDVEPHELLTGAEWDEHVDSMSEWFDALDRREGAGR